MSRVAVDLLDQARRRGVTEDDLVDDVLRHTADLELDTWQSQALASLFQDPIDVDRFWINGQHRAQAMLDAGVRETVMTQLQPPEGPMKTNPLGFEAN